MTRKKREIDYESPEVQFEAPEVDFETPARVTHPDSFDPGECWCGKKRPGCTGNPTVVRHLWGKQYQFVCPFGRDRSSVESKVFEAAKRAGLVS